jgi:hypothetical protein
MDDQRVLPPIRRRKDKRILRVGGSIIASTWKMHKETKLL